MVDEEICGFVQRANALQKILDEKLENDWTQSWQTLWENWREETSSSSPENRQNTHEPIQKQEIGKLVRELHNIFRFPQKGGESNVKYGTPYGPTTAVDAV